MSNEPDFRQARGIRFDWTITAGNVLTAFGALILAGGAYVDYRVTIDRHDLRITATEAALSSIRLQQTDQIKSQVETTRALDRLTYQLQAKQP